jgi:hypothetical protein
MKAALIFLAFSVFMLTACSQNTSLKLIGSVNGNIYSLNIGVGLMDSTGEHKIYYSTPTPAISFDYSITVDKSGTYFLVVYVDDNSDKVWNYKGNGKKDSYFTIEPYGLSLYDNVTYYDINIRGKFLNGTINGADTNLFDRISFGPYSTPVSGNMYVLKMYVNIRAGNFVNHLKLFGDLNSNFIYDRGEPFVYNQQTDLGSGAGGLSNTIDILISRSIAHITTNGNASGYSHPRIIEMLTSNTSVLADCTLTNYINTNNATNIDLVYKAFNDLNNNGIMDDDEPIISINNPLLNSTIDETNIIINVTN